MTIEEWREVSFAPHILVSDKGRFKNSRTGKLKRSSPNSLGYPYVPIYYEGRPQIFQAAKLVAAAFKEDYDPIRTIKYADGDRGNIAADNLVCRMAMSEYYERMQDVREHAVRVRIIELDMVFLNASAAAHYIRGHPTSVYACLRGTQMTHRGYTFERITTQEMLEHQRRRDGY